MEQEYSKDFFWDTYKKLPEDLKEALFSDKNNEVVGHICAQAGLDEEQTAGIAKFIGRVLMGLLPLSEFPIIIELELNIKQDLASQINRQVYISVFKHLRVSLNKINDANFGYVDLFTSESDGKEEEKRREEIRQPDSFIKKNSFEMKTIAEFPKPSTAPSEIKNEKIEKSQTPTQVNEPPFSYAEPLPVVEIEKIENPDTLVSAPEKTSVEEKKIEKPIPSAPSRNAFEQELQKDINFPEIPMPLEVGPIPTITIEADGIKKESIPLQEASPNVSIPPISSNVSKNLETPNVSEVPKEISTPSSKAPIVPTDIDSSKVKIDEFPKNPFPSPDPASQSKDPYKETPI
ncbi:MAG: hypothetical protein WCX30_00970 [Candidatus Paceibacterota bacterium]|jgi:hypothetical protein|nr:hypothetical protein [bacterium]